MIRITQVKLPIRYQKTDIEKAITKKLGISQTQIISFEIAKRSLDARKKPDLYYVFTVDVHLDSKTETTVLKRNRDKDIQSYEKPKFTIAKCEKEHDTVYVIGSGPAGYFCMYYLVKNGYKAVLLERGSDVEKRTEDVQSFLKGNPLNLENNVQFGEGGAGTFSDGKLNTLVKDKDGLMHAVLSDYIAFGAEESILYDAKPHIGTDVLKTVITNMRNEIIRLGGEIRFLSKLTDIEIVNGTISGITVNENEQISCKNLVLAIGHSARDTYEMLNKRGVCLEQKNFAVGFRVQHPQEMINRSQYGEIDAKTLELLGPAAYKVTHQADGIGIYSFCMCPGGYVINSSSEENRLAINGMSYHDRSSKNANSAIILTVEKEEFASDAPLAGIAFQRDLEEKAFRLGNGKIPCQYLKDFVNNIPSVQSEDHLPLTEGDYVFTNLRNFFPEAKNKAFLEGMKAFGRMIHGFDDDYTILSVVESRTSSPVRITRDNDTFECNISGIYPCGEGAGYAGGITSAAMDGIRTAIRVAKKINNN